MPRARRRRNEFVALPGLKTWATRVLAAIGLASLAWWAYTLAVPEPEDDLPETLASRPSTTAAAARFLATHLDAPLLRGGEVRLLENGDEIFPAMLGAIRGARRTIDFQTYVWWEGAVARDFAMELAAAARRGVVVRVLVDAFGARKMDSSLVAGMRDAGCRVETYHPLSWTTLGRFNNRSHRRVLVVDESTGFTGGVGVAAEWSGDARDEGHWRDDHFRLTGPAVAWLDGAFAENWRQVAGEALAPPPESPEAPGDSLAGPWIVPIFGVPGGSVSAISFTYWLSLAMARERVDIATPYFVPDPQLRAAIAATARRGVRVRLLVPDEHNDATPVRWASQALYPELLEAGVRIFEYQPTMFHVKVLRVDDAWAVVGSSNFDNRSFELNYEFDLALVDPGLAAELDRSFERDLGRSREITRETTGRRSAPGRARDRLTLFLREQL